MSDDLAAQEPPVLGLRERKKRRTRATIARVALELFARQGYQATTIAQIAEAAEVSPRTVSAYFPTKEDLVFPHEPDSLARLEACLHERPRGESAPEALRTWIDAELPGWLEREPEYRLQRQVVAAETGLQAYRRRFMGEAEELMAAAIARDLDVSPDDLEPRMAASATVAILDLLDELQGPPSSAGLAEWRREAMRLIDRAVLFVSAGVRGLGATPPRGSG